MDSNTSPAWWTPDHDSAWERVKDAVRRDWEQTKHDLSMKTGQEHNQRADDTVKQALAKQPMPAGDEPNPPRAIGTWDWVQGPIQFGYGARRSYGRRFPKWSDELERDLQADWRATRKLANEAWSDVKRWVRHGYEYVADERRPH